MEITPFAGGIPPEPEVDLAQAPAAAPAVQTASLAGPAASLSQLAAAAAPAESAPGAAATRLVESSMLAQSTKLHLHDQVGDMPEPIPGPSRQTGGRDLVSYTPIQLPNVAEGEDEEPPVQAHTLDGAGAPGSLGRDLVSYTPITIPNTPEGEERPAGPGGDLRGDMPIPLPNVPDEASSLGGVRGPGAGLIGITPINLPNTPDGGSVPPGPGGGDPVGLREALQAKLLNLHTESSSVGGVAGQGAAGVGITPINLPNTPDGGSTPPGPGGGDPVRQK